MGSLAAACTTFAFVPQIIRLRKLGGASLSWGMLLVYLLGVLLWLGYGIGIHAQLMVAANAMAAVLVAATAILKWLTPDRPAPWPVTRTRPRIAIDMDEVIADSHGKFLRLYNARFGESLSMADLEGLTLEEAVPAARVGVLREIVLEPTFFEDLAVIPGSQEVIRALGERYEVFIATAAMEVPTGFAAKYAWLREHFPFIPPSHILFCGDKGVLDVDYLIDDRARHFKNFRGQAVLFGSHHNRHERGYLRVDGWEEVRRLFLGPTASPISEVRS